MPTVNAPIWKDTTYDEVQATNSPYEYNIKLKTGRQITIDGITTDEVITVFSGKAWARPDEDHIHINVNNIAQNFLYGDLPDLRTISANTAYTNTYELRQFYLTNSADTTACTYNFVWDYSYKDFDFTSNHTMSNPINGHGTPGMLFLSTDFSASSLSVVTSLKISGSSSYDETHCGDYAVYYLNRNGGWDSFLIEGQVVKTDNFTRHQMGLSYSNTSIDYHKRTYNNEINESYQLSTGWLSDAQSAILAEHLLSSNQVYLHDLTTNKIMPVVINDTSVVYKTYRNQKRRLVSYTIKVETSQTKHIIG